MEPTEAPAPAGGSSRYIPLVVAAHGDAPTTESAAEHKAATYTHQPALPGDDATCI